jgi:hypothetical protein
LPRGGSRGVGVAAPQVGYRLAVDEHRRARAHVLAVKQLGERLPDGVESLVALPRNFSHGPT